MSRRLLAGVVVACTVGAAGAMATTGPGAAAPAQAGCVFLRVHSVGGLGLSVLTKVRLSDGALDRVGVLGYRVDALGHAPGSPLSYGLASRSLTGPFADGAHVITVDARGAVRDLGPVRGPDLPKDRLTGATAGTIHQGDLLVRDGHYLYAIELDPNSPRYLGLTRTTELRPYELARTVDDFDTRDGMLYGVSAHVAYYGKVVRIDPVTGRVTYALGHKLPAGRPYGAALIGPDGALYAAANRIAGRSRFYRVDLYTPHASVRPIAVWPAVDAADATGCVANAPAPPPVGGPTATNTRPPAPGAGPTQTNTRPPAPGVGPPQTNTRPPAPGVGPPQTNTRPPAPGVGPPGTNTRPPAPGAAPSQTNTRPHEPGVAVPEGNVLPPMSEISGSVGITLFPPAPGANGPTATNTRPPAPPVVLPPLPPAPSPTAPPTTPIPPPPPQAVASPPPAPPATKRPKFRASEPPPPVAMDTRGDKTEKKRRWGVAVLVLVLGAGAAASRVRHR
ncbi:hypothetical protein SAMN05192558_104404 [Actinokineospora alba]|uniref:DUF6923 domain-containing protein n=1 Tax=Actinokineospora alba TaxID=504798 RepID=A0A1H0M3J6_9PSEU|nr:hypothetical protein [Actinokineospora alba]TDP67575.1 hypothetical protein C8E96_3121 [Actinokineospora alba]SDI45195.1 hypothetical protein SAMN05421871_10556 [Actinokineospora alba]SDO75052.1 hypothetical protein SAMN05192558_104404 [Actinokineospora alba]